MALTPRLDLKQSQQLVMTPQLQQAIKLLALSNLEISEFIAEEVERNPILDVADPGENAPGGDERGEGGGTATEEGLRDTHSGDTGGGENSSDGAESELITADQPFDTGFDTSTSQEAALDTDLDQSVFHHDSPADSGISQDSGSGLSLDGISGGGTGKGPDERSLDQTLEGEIGLADHLTQQIPFVVTDPADMLIASHLIDMVDEAGYLPTDVAHDISDRLGSHPDQVEAVISRLQMLEPTGVFARSLSECLALQLAEKDRLDPAMQAFLDNLDLLARGDTALLKKKCGIDEEDLADMVLEIRSLNPKPGLLYGATDVTPVVPDVFIRKNRAGSWIVELNTETLPKLLINNQYVSELETLAGDKETRLFISECQSGANWLLKALDQRARTILKVSSALVKMQEQFFEHGVRFLKPMTLRDIADEIDMHESTVSRVTSNKFLSCSRGLFELKYFFTSSINASNGGDALSAESVKYRIKELIDTEAPKKILSDDKLVQMLKTEGMDIARRTVAKYREALRIPSSVQRRRQKNIK